VVKIYDNSYFIDAESNQPISEETELTQYIPMQLAASGKNQ
jgi:hypothetical protein